MTHLHTATLDWITPDPERTVSHHARVSTKNPNREEYEKLLRFCIKKGHWSIFEQVCASYEILTIRAISAQILRHRSFHFQELSTRYCAPNDVLSEAWAEAAEFEIRAQDFKDRQNSLEFTDETVKGVLRDRIRELFKEIEEVYNLLLESGVARECARHVLPLASPTRMHMQGTLRDWLFYVGLRAGNGTQTEHKLIAAEIGRSLAKQVPTVIKAVLESDSPFLNGWREIEDLHLPQ